MLPNRPARLGAGQLEEPHAARQTGRSRPRVPFGFAARRSSPTTARCKPLLSDAIDALGRAYRPSRPSKAHLPAPAVDVGQFAADIAREGGDGKTPLCLPGRSDNDVAGLAHRSGRLKLPIGRRGPNQARRPVRRSGTGVFIMSPCPEAPASELPSPCSRRAWSCWRAGWPAGMIHRDRFCFLRNPVSRHFAFAASREGDEGARGPKRESTRRAGNERGKGIFSSFCANDRKSE